MKRWITIALSLAAAAMLAGCVDRQAQKQAQATRTIVSDPTKAISVMPVVPQSISETLDITGQVTAGQDAQIGAKLSGKLIAVYVNDGDPVSTGQIIAIQDTSVQQAQLRQALANLSTASSQLSQAISNARVGPQKSASAVGQAQAQLKSAQASLTKLKNGARKEERIQMDWTVKQAKTNLDVAQQDVDRKQKLFDQGAIPKSQLEQAQNGYMTALTQYNAAVQNQAIQNSGARTEDIAVAQEAVSAARLGLQQAMDQQKLDVLYGDQVNSARAAVQSAQASVDVARQALLDSEIKAPFAGRISGKPSRPGEIVGPGSTIARVIGSGGNYFEGNVPETEVTRIQPGRPVAIAITAMPGKTLSGHVAAVNPLGSDVGRVFSVRVGFDSFSPGLKPGMFAHGAVTLSVIPNAIVVPADAVVNYKDQQVVWVLNGPSGVKPLNVTTGLREGDNIQIVRGLGAGEKVVIRGQEGLTEKSKVRVQDQKTTAAAALPAKTAGG